jgi:hypothetical protein
MRARPSTMNGRPGGHAPAHGVASGSSEGRLPELIELVSTAEPNPSVVSSCVSTDSGWVSFVIVAPRFFPVCRFPPDARKLALWE